jgi:hypothetical protein
MSLPEAGAAGFQSDVKLIDRFQVDERLARSAKL